MDGSETQTANPPETAEPTEGQQLDNLLAEFEQQLKCLKLVESRNAEQIDRKLRKLGSLRSQVRIWYGLGDEDIHRAFRTAANELVRDGELEVDANAIVALSDDGEGCQGAYVAAWVYIPITDIPRHVWENNENCIDPEDVDG